MNGDEIESGWDEESLAVDTSCLPLAGLAATSRRKCSKARPRNLVRTDAEPAVPELHVKLRAALRRASTLAPAGRS